MQNYIGTKIVQAEPMKLVDAEEKLQRKIKPGNEDGYLVSYSDGYESWSPKVVFEDSYHFADSMTFGLALEALKKHQKIARHGWNGKDQYVTLIPAGNAMFQGHNMQDCFGLKNAQGNMQPGWVPSIGDCLAGDWYIAE